MPLTRASIPLRFVQAAEQGDLARMHRLFQEHGDSLVAATKDAALLAASRNGHLHIVQYLVETVGANISATDSSGVTAMD
jgi:ankyrin repeat protein